MNVIRFLSPLLISIGIMAFPLKGKDPEPENKTSEKLFCEDSHKKNLPEQTSSEQASPDQTPLKEEVEEQEDQKSELPSDPEKISPQPIPSKDSSKEVSALQALLQEAANKQRVPEYAFLKNEGLSMKFYHTILTTSKELNMKLLDTILATANWCHSAKRSLENLPFPFPFIGDLLGVSIGIGILVGMGFIIYRTHNGLLNEGYMRKSI